MAAVDLPTEFDAGGFTNGVFTAEVAGALVDVVGLDDPELVLLLPLLAERLPGRIPASPTQTVHGHLELLPPFSIRC